MSKTKQKILEHSLRLFNDQGVSSISLRDIAESAGISVGNLQYHFKKREDIIQALYYQLVASIDAIMIIPDDNLLKAFFDLSKEMITLLFGHRFFLLDFNTIVKNNSTIKAHYTELSSRREAQFTEGVQLLIACGYFRKEEIKGEYQQLFQRIEVLSNFWFSAALIQGKTLDDSCIEGYSLAASQSIFPYLTEEGRRLYCLEFPEQAI